METKTFKTLFTPYTDMYGKTIDINKIEIPKIQRDYAYGRTDAKNSRKRESFLNSLLKAVNGNPITLDFIYGAIDGNVLTPLDGQQRLTTLTVILSYLGEFDLINGKLHYNVRNETEKFLKEYIFKPNNIKSIQTWEQLLAITNNEGNDYD